MFWPEVTTLQQFYTSPCGQVMAQRIGQKIASLWPNIQQETVIGIGFPAPYFEDIIKHTHHVALFMPAAQGVIHWPEGGKNHSCITHEGSLPLADNSVDRVILAHTLEYTEHPHLVIRELWRVLTPKGKLLVMVPNRLGMWAHMGNSPFVSGRAFHRFELSTLLQDAFFLPLNTSSLLFAPPGFPDMVVKSPLWESIGTSWLQPFGGILMAEGEKQLYAATPQKHTATNPIKLLMPTMP